MGRGYGLAKLLPVVTFVLILSACAANRVTSEEGNRGVTSADDDAIIREPASMTGKHEWLNEVHEDFSRIAEETTLSTRSVASKKPEILIQRPRWAFSYHPDNNQFTLKIDGTNFSMTQTSFDDNNNFSFAAQGQIETPITLSVMQGAARAVTSEEEEDKKDASGTISASSLCNVELNFWDTKAKKYIKDSAAVQGERCAKVMAQLRSYVP